MIETALDYNGSISGSPDGSTAAERYPSDDLKRYRYHTGATLRPLAPDEPCPVLFRDIGFEAMVTFLRGELTRLAGPLTPVTYMRTADYEEPYTDYEQIGRLVFLRPLAVQPWHSGVDTVFVSRATRMIDPSLIGFVPGDVALEDAGRMLADARDTSDLRDAFGGTSYETQRRHELARLEALCEEFWAAEEKALPLRKMLQGGDYEKSMRARELMARHDIDENDLCAAWHHVPRERRDRLVAALEECSL
ncbi:hypothetical protein FIV42_16510 [Persicimonas caeni]|uniref:Uncharacterized protein n=1 Tax=Persicimonas caeni TaxID=2292766 RepID=A0A4Y6PVC6_PERCE|nr:hypothetical protein [Persicimonas caeni]QDG52282.1 hypothetical protein FIV42_16510 [Persicimonas caeni]QED33504.1 hypothetical protein FRD00_16505 [Persicimonas caeni]